MSHLNEGWTGDPYVICDLCHFKRRASETRMQWDGLRVCVEEWNEKPQEYWPIPHFKNEGLPAIRNPRNEGADTFQTITYTSTDPNILGTSFIYIAIGSTALTANSLTGSTSLQIFSDPTPLLKVLDKLQITLDNASIFTTTVTALKINQLTTNSYQFIITIADTFPSQASSGNKVLVLSASKG